MALLFIKSKKNEEYPIFNATSCALSYTLNQADYNSFFCSEFCKANNCPLSQKKRCEDKKKLFKKEDIQTIIEKFKEKIDCEFDFNIDLTNNAIFIEKELKTSEIVYLKMLTNMKIVCKKKLDDLPQQLDKFKKGTIIKGYSQEVINKLVDFIEHNVSYSFNKSHGVAYGTTTYKTAYLKCHYPVEYMAAIINNQRTEDGTTDFDSIKRYIKAANTDGIEVVSPDVNVSGLKFTPIGNSITYGLGLIKGLSTNGSKIVVENRPYTSYESFLESVGLLLNKSDVESLIKANAFRNITNLTQMEQFELYYKLRFNNSKEENKPIKKINKTHIKYLLDNGLITPEDATNTEYCVKVINKERALQGWQDFKNKYCKGTALDWEMEVLNCHLSGSPFKDVVLSSWDKLPYDHNGYVGGVLISIKETLVKKGKSAGQKMCFLNIDVNGEIFDLVVFSNNYLIYKSILKTGNCIVCRTTKQGDKKGIVQGCELLNNYVKRTRSMQPQNVLERFKV